MSIVFNILKEELQRLKQLSQKYIKEINKLPKGSISLKKRFHKSFAYLAYRQNNKVKFKYLGGLGSSSLAQLKEKIQKRKQYELKRVTNTKKT
jgi:hypothetical protein